jgi:hypothetical protein
MSLALSRSVMRIVIACQSGTDPALPAPPLLLVPQTVYTLHTAGQARATSRQLLAGAQPASVRCCLHCGALCAGASSAQQAAAPQRQQQQHTGCSAAADTNKPAAQLLLLVNSEPSGLEPFVL